MRGAEADAQHAGTAGNATRKDHEMRKYCIGALACGLALALTLTGCGGNASSGEGAAPNEGASQGQEQEPEVQEEPSFNAEDFFGCWEYAEGYGWLYIYGDGTYEWFYDDGTSDEGSYEIDDDGVLSIDGSDLVFAIGEDGVMVDSDGDELFQSELPDFDYTPTPEEGGGDHDSGRDYEVFAGTSWLFSPEIFSFNDDGTVDVYGEDDHSLVGFGEYYWSADAEVGQVYLATPEFGETIMEMYFDSMGNLVFDEGPDATSYFLSEL